MRGRSPTPCGALPTDAWLLSSLRFNGILRGAGRPPTPCDALPTDAWLLVDAGTQQDVSLRQFFTYSCPIQTYALSRVCTCTGNCISSLSPLSSLSLPAGVAL